MKTVHVDKMEITGISVRTTNACEMNPETAKIGALHQRFDDKVSIDYKNGARVYGVYYDYASDENGEFSILAGADRISESSLENPERVSIAAGEYLVFRAQGEIPAIVIETWSKVWAYFSANEAGHERAFTTDFELYRSQDVVELYIAVR